MSAYATLTDAAEGAILCWLATVDADGRPSVSPKEIWYAPSEDRIVIADIASAGSVRNIRANPAVCVSFIHVFEKRGMQCKGHARLVARGDPEFDTLGAELLRRAGETYPIRHLMVIDIDRRAPILAPSYDRRPHLTLDERIAETQQQYGVRPL